LASFNPDGSIKTSDGRTIFADDPVTVGEFAELSKLLVPQKAGGWPFAHGGGGGFVASGGGGGGNQVVTAPVGNGAQGAQGSQGAQGPGVGAQGAQGSQGSGGAQGTAGAQGSQGPAGSGAQGAQGSAGPQGMAGAQGSQGTIGAQGAQGSGAQGAQGAAGAQGSQGTVGAQGAQGTGAQGAQGSAGAQGAQGSQGPSGAGSQAIFENVQQNTLTTVDATPTTILSETIAVGEVATFRVVVDARYDDGSQHASFVKTIIAFREGGGAVLGTSNADYTDDSSFALVADFSTSGNDLIVQIIGVAATSITWKARMGRVALP